MIIGLLGLYCLSMVKTSICWVPWTFTPLLVHSDTCHPFAYFLATSRGLNYIVIDILFSLPSLLLSLPPVLASSLLPFLPAFCPPLFFFTISYCFCLSTEQVYKYTQSFQRRKCRLHFQWVQTRVRIKTEAQKYQNLNSLRIFKVSKNSGFIKSNFWKFSDIRCWKRIVKAGEISNFIELNYIFNLLILM